MERSARLVMTPYWWIDGPATLRRFETAIDVAPAEVALLGSWSSPTTVADVAARTGADAAVVARVADRLVAAGVLTQEREVRYEAGGLAIELELTGACNADCIMCPRDVLHAHRGFRHMDVAVFDRILANVGGRGIKAYCLAGIGEPILHPRWLELAWKLRAADPDATLVCYTNGSAVLDLGLARLLDSPIDDLVVSVHAVDRATHGMIMRWSPPGDVLGGIDRLLDAVRRRPRPMRVEVQQVLVAGAAEPDEALRRFAADRGLTYTVASTWNRAGHVPAKVLAGDRFAAAGRPNVSPQWCRHYAGIIYIDHRGHVLSCCCDVANETTETSACETGLEEIVRGRLARLASGRSLSPICHRCDASETNKPFLPTGYYALARRQRE